MVTVKFIISSSKLYFLNCFSAKIQSYSKNCSTGNLTRHLKNERNIREIDSPSTSLASRGKISSFFNKCTPIKSHRDSKWALGRELAL